MPHWLVGWLVVEGIRGSGDDKCRGARHAVLCGDRTRACKPAYRSLGGLPAERHDVHVVRRQSPPRRHPGGLHAPVPPPSSSSPQRR